MKVISPFSQAAVRSFTNPTLSILISPSNIITSSLAPWKQLFSFTFAFASKLVNENPVSIQSLNETMHKYDDGDIFDFRADVSTVKLAINWINFPPNPEVLDFTTIIIDAEKIYWENRPDLVDPNW